MSTIELPLRILIVDDEPPARNRLRDLLHDCGEQLTLEVAGEAGNGQEALDLLTEVPIDVVLLDIRMPQMDGIELAQHIQKMPKPVFGLGEGAGVAKWPPVIVFTTAYDSYAIKAFELHAIDYLLEESLTALEKEFATRFVRIHRNCLVAKEAIEGFERGGEEGESSGWMVKLKGSEELLAISRRQQHIVKEFS